MDWRSLIDERLRREEMRRSAQGSTQMAAVAPVAQEEDDGGFFGKLASVGKGIGSFFGGMVQDLADTTEEAGKTVRDIVQSPIKQARSGHDTDRAMELLKEMNQKTANWAPEDYDKPENKAMLKESMDKIKALQESSRQWQESDTIDDRDAVKSAAATAETFLNVATLGAGGVVLKGGKQAGKQVLKQGAKEVAEQTAKQATKRTAGGAAKTIAKNATEGALIGAAYGGLQPLKTQGSEATNEDLWRSALFGGALGGAAGGGLSLLDKNVRAGVREMPGAVRRGGEEALENVRQLTPSAIAERHPAVLAFDDQYSQLAQRYDNITDPTAKKQISQAMAQNRAERGRTLQGVQEGGYIGRGPAGPEDLNIDDMLSANTNKRPAPEMQRQLEDAWNTNDLTTAQRIIDEMPEEMRVSMQPIQDYRLRDVGATGTSIDRASTGAEVARRQLGGEDIRPLTAAQQGDEDLAQSIAASYRSADDYIDDAARRAMDTEGGLRGGQMIPDGEGGYRRISEHSPWYREMFAETGRAPSKQAVRDRVEEALRTGSDGGGLVYPDESRVYQLLRDRDAGMEVTLAQGPPPDLAGQFMDDLGIPQTPSRATGRANSTRIPSGLPKGPQAGQEALSPVDPYAGWMQDLNRPALPAGPAAPLPTSRQAKAAFRKTGEAPAEFLDVQTPGKTPVALPASADELGAVGTRMTPGGKVKPMKYVSTDEIDAIRKIAADDTSSSFTSTRTPDMNLEEAFRKRGGADSKEFKVLSGYNTSIREHTANYTSEVTQRRGFLERFIKEFQIDGKKAQGMRPYLEAADDTASQAALDAYRKEFGDQAADGLRRLRDWWRAEKDIVRNETNAVIGEFAGPERLIGDLGETYVPRVYRSGLKGFKDAVLDVKHAGMEKLGGKKGLFNLENNAGYLSKETETMGGVLRNAEGIPLNSEFAKPKTTFLSAAQKRTAKSPIKELEDPLTSMMRYFEATSRAKHMTPDIAKGQELRQAIELVNNETGNLRQMYKSIEDQVNAVAGKTSNIDRYVVDRAGGNQFVNVATKLQSRIARSTILGSAQSAFAQTGQLPLIVAENGANNFRKGLSDMVKMIRSKADDPMGQSALMKTRYPKYEQMFAVKKSTKAANKGTAIVAKPFRIIEHAASEAAWRSSYNKVLETGLKGKAAIQEADRITAKIIGERSAGARAALYESKALGPVTSYTLEVNQLYQVAKQYFKRDPKKAMKLVGAIWLYNQGYEAVTGNKLNADLLDAGLDVANIMTTDELLDDEGYPIGFGERLVRSGGRFGGEVIDATPLGGPVAGSLYPERGFRIPFGGGERTLGREEIFGDTNFGRYGGGTPLASGISNPLLMLGIPGMAQLQRGVEGYNAYNQGLSETPSGDIRFQIENDPENFWRSILFGMYNTREGREYLAARQASLAGQSQQGGLRY